MNLPSNQRLWVTLASLVIGLWVGYLFGFVNDPIFDSVRGLVVALILPLVPIFLLSFFLWERRSWRPMAGVIALSFLVSYFLGVLLANIIHYLE